MKLMNVLAYESAGLYNLLELARTCQSLRDALLRWDLDGCILAFPRKEDDAADEVHLPVTLPKEGSFSTAFRACKRKRDEREKEGSAVGTYLLGKQHQLVLVGKEQQGHGVVNRQTVICRFFAASNLVPVCTHISPPPCSTKPVTNRIVPIRLSTKSLYSSAEASLRAFQTF